MHHPHACARSVLRALAVDDREDAIRPLVRDRVELAVQPAWRHRLRVQARMAHLSHNVVIALLRSNERERGSKRAVAARLAGERQADNHETVAHEEHLVHFEDLRDESPDGLQLLLHDDAVDCLHKPIVIGRRQLDAREKVARDAVEEGCQRSMGRLLVGGITRVRKLAAYVCSKVHRIRT